jgi:hypothetical protein
MKKLTAALLASAMISGQAFAGGLAEPIVEPLVIEERAPTGTAAGIIVPILALVLFGLAITGGNGDSGDDGGDGGDGGDAVF